MSTTVEKIAVMQAWEDGKPIEVRRRSGDDWVTVKRPIETPIWDWSLYDYRIAQPSKPGIDWSHVAPEYKWMARDLSGRVYLYPRKPYPSSGAWFESGYVPASAFASARPGDCDWRESLVSREDAS